MSDKMLPWDKDTEAGKTDTNREKTRVSLSWGEGIVAQKHSTEPGIVSGTGL